MSESFHLDITPRDPVIARDGRPAATGLRMRSVDWPYPSVLAGSLRTLVGQLLGGFPSDGAASRELIERLRNIEIAGPLPSVNRQLAFPAPLDVAVREDGGIRLHAARPAAPAAEAGCDLPSDHGLFPVMLPDTIADDFKPATVPAFWSATRMEQWLADARGESFLTDDADQWPQGHFQPIVRDNRFHTAINQASGAAERSQLFMTVGLDCARLLIPKAKKHEWPASPEASIVARVVAVDEIAGVLQTLRTWSPFGGERRLARWTSCPSEQQAAIWSPPAKVTDALNARSTRDAKYIRMVLATPAVFAGGWLPGWLKKDAGLLRGKIPGTNLVVRLIGASVGRWKPISGWSFESPRGEKPARRLVPAGSVYFFQCDQGSPADLATKAWLKPVSDQPQDCRDGFGLALWGVWEPFNANDRFDTSET